jgi:enoyl-CoA hydratase/carnithine racemase
MSYRTIEFTNEGGIARLTLNRPERLNSFTVEMHGEVRDALGRLEGARVLVLTGRGAAASARGRISTIARWRRARRSISAIRSRLTTTR